MHFFLKLIFLFMCWNTACSHVLSRIPNPITGVGPVLWKIWGLLQQHLECSLRWRLGRARCRRGVQATGLWLPAQHLQLESVRPQNGSDQPHQPELLGTGELPGEVLKAQRLWCPQLQQHSGGCCYMFRWLRRRARKDSKWRNIFSITSDQSEDPDFVIWNSPLLREMLTKKTPTYLNTTFFPRVNN